MTAKKLSKVFRTPPAKPAPAEPSIINWTAIKMRGPGRVHDETCKRLKDAGYTFTTNPCESHGALGDYIDYTVFVSVDIYKLGEYKPA